MKIDQNKKNKKHKNKKLIKEKYVETRKSNKGVISIYLCLILAVLLPVILIMVEAARVNAMKTHMECVTDMGMDSILAEYHRELFDRYGVLFVDTSYGEKYGSEDNVTDRLKDYMSYNLNPQKNLLSAFDSRDLLGLKVDSIDVLSMSRATDNKGEVFKYMANSYMLEKFGIGYIDDAKNLIAVSDQNKLLEGDILAENENAQNTVNSIEMPKYQKENGEWEEVDRCNPTVAVNEMRRKGVLSLVCENNVSSKTTDLTTLASHRNLVAGNGLYEEWDKRSSIETELLFNEYILLKCGNYTDIRDNSLLDYQVEYIIAGKNNDTDNLKDVANKLLLIRGTSNSIYFANHEKLQEEAELLAKGLAIITLLPELEDIYEAAIIAAWIFSESVYDVKTLMAGGKIPFIKGEGEWNLTIEKALLLTSAYAAGVDIDVNKNRNGQSYKDYLRVLLYATNKDDRTFRCMDVVEMDMREITDDDSFSLDDCITSFKIQIIASSSYGYSLIAHRQCSYW